MFQDEPVSSSQRSFDESMSLARPEVISFNGSRCDAGNHSATALLAHGKLPGSPSPRMKRNSPSDHLPRAAPLIARRAPSVKRRDMTGCVAASAAAQVAGAGGVGSGSVMNGSSSPSCTVVEAANTVFAPAPDELAREGLGLRDSAEQAHRGKAAQDGKVAKFHGFVSI